MREWHELSEIIKNELLELDKRPDDLDLRYKISENALNDKRYDLAINLLLDVN